MAEVLPPDECYWTSIGSGNDLVTSGNKLLSEPNLTQIYVDISRH